MTNISVYLAHMTHYSFSTVKQELTHSEKVLTMLKPQILSQNKEALKKRESVKKQQENKVRLTSCY